jgi:hypothetical protein
VGANVYFRKVKLMFRMINTLATSEKKNISTVNAKVDDDARYTVDDISDISGLRAPYVFQA